HRRGVRRDAGPEIESDAVQMIARPRRAVLSAFLQAGDMRIAKIPAARALREIAAERREMTDLRRCQPLRRCRKARIGLRYAGIAGDRRDGGEGADARGAILGPMYSGAAGR